MTEQEGRDQSAVDYELEFTTPQGTVERAVVTATLIQEGTHYLSFIHGDDLVLLLPHSSVVHVGELPFVRDFVKVEGDGQAGAGFLEFSNEPRDPWAELSGRT